MEAIARSGMDVCCWILTSAVRFRGDKLVSTQLAIDRSEENLFCLSVLVALEVGNQAADGSESRMRTFGCFIFPLFF